MHFISPMRQAARCLAFALVAVFALTAAAADLNVASSGGFAAAYAALAPDFEQKTGHKLDIVWGPSMGETPNTIPSRLARGEPLDVVILVGSALDALVQTKRVLPGDNYVLALSKIGMAVKSGAAKPDISTVEKLRKVLLDAHSIGYSDSASGVYLSTELFPRLGISEQLSRTARKIPAEPVAKVVARGEVEIGFQPISEILPVSGVDFVAPLPEDAQQVTVYSAGIVAGSSHSDLAKQFIAYLRSPGAAAIIRKTGLNPVAEKTD